MSKYKDGEKVWYTGAYGNQEVTIKSNLPSPSLSQEYYEIDFDNGQTRRRFDTHLSTLKKSNDTKEFKIGDKVKVVTHKAFVDVNFGDEGIITEISSTYRDIKCKFPNRLISTNESYFKTFVEKIEEPLVTDRDKMQVGVKVFWQGDKAKIVERNFISNTVTLRCFATGNNFKNVPIDQLKLIPKEPNIVWSTPNSTIKLREGYSVEDKVIDKFANKLVNYCSCGNPSYQNRTIATNRRSNPEDEYEFCINCKKEKFNP